MPLVNITELENIFSRKWLTKDGKTEVIKDTLGFAGVYPRWIGIGNLSTISDNKTPFKSINTVFQLGNTKKEAQIKVGEGFPNLTLNQNEIIVPEIFAEFLGL